MMIIVIVGRLITLPMSTGCICMSNFRETSVN